MRIGKKYHKNAKIVLFPGFVEDFISSLPKNSIDLVITSPPYNVGKEYEDKLDLDQYLLQHEAVIAQLYDLMSNSGSICWQVGNYVRDEEIFPLDIFYYRLFKKYKFVLKNRIIWHYGHGYHAHSRFSGRYETILWFTKGNNYVFNLDEVRVSAKYPGKRHHRGPNKGKPSGNPKGKNPSDVWEVLRTEWDEAFWDIPNVKSNHVEKTEHPCQFPVELVERCILALTNEKALVFDPYAGVGSTLIAAIKNNRRAIGCEKEKSYQEIAKQRILKFGEGNLQLRPLGKPIYEPTGTEKVAQVPVEWKNKNPANKDE